MNTKPFKLELLPGTEYKSCSIYDNGAYSLCPEPPQLRNKYAGELEYDGYSYSFYYPNKSNCQGQPDFKNCKLILGLSKDTADNLASKNTLLKDYFKKIDSSNKAGIETQGNDLRTDYTNPSNPFITVGLPLFGGVIIFIVLYYIFTNVFGIELLGGNYRPTNKKQRSKSIQGPPLDSLSLPSASNYNASNTAASQDLNNKLSYIFNKLKDISSRLDSLETDVCALNQQNQLQAPRSRGSTISDQSYGFNLDNLQSITKPLGIDLLKEAVATINYDLIRDFPHFFVSETQESRQGLTNVERFILEGDESQAGSRTQSEFIAINCNDQTYLIPNILPNALNPERTLKRHADRNNIYRNGQGTNLLKLEELAVIQRNGDHFDLKSIGQIA